MGVVKEWQSMAEQVGELSESVLTEDQKDKVRRLICANAAGATVAEQMEDAEALMLALGVHPTQSPLDEYAVLSTGHLNSSLGVTKP